MKRFWIPALMVVLAVFMTIGLANAADPVSTGQTKVTLSAQVGGTTGASAPVIRNAFMLPDMNDATPAIDLIAPYEAIPNADGMANVTPNLQNIPQQWMGFWALVGDPNGIGNLADVYVDVYHPDGSIKYQVHMTEQTCASLGSATTAGTPLGGAVYTGQKTAAEAAVLLEACYQDQLRPFFGIGEITKDQPYGLYSFRVGAMDDQGNVSFSTPAAPPGNYTFVVNPVSGLALDFSTVNFGSIIPTERQITDGDDNWCPGTTGNLPTVMSTGNVWLNLNVRFGPMETQTITPRKVIDVFDIVLGKVDTNPITQERVIVDPIAVNVNQLISGYILLPDCPTKIQFSIHPELLGTIRTANGQSGVPVDTYAGSVSLWGTPSAIQWLYPFNSPVAGEWETLLDACPAEYCMQ